MLMFLLPPDTGEKITLGVTILLAFFVNSLVVSNYTPEGANKLPVIGNKTFGFLYQLVMSKLKSFYNFLGLYSLLNIGLVSLSIGSSVCVLIFHFRGHKMKRVPDWLKKVLFLRHEKPERKNERNGIKMMAYSNFVVNSPAMTTVEAQKRTTAMTTSHKKMANSKYSMNFRNSSPIANYNMKPAGEIMNGREEYKMLTASSEIWNLPDVARCENDEQLERIIKLLKKSSRLLEKNQADEANAKCVYDEWKRVAARLDFLFFVVSFTAIIVTPVVLFGKFFIHGGHLKNTNYTSCGCEH
jgi:hypothetical protein